MENGGEGNKEYCSINLNNKEKLSSRRASTLRDVFYAYASGGVGVSPAAYVYDKQCIILQFLVIESVQILMIFLTPVQELWSVRVDVFSAAKVVYLF